MADISLSTNHGMTLEEAKEKAQSIASDVKNQFPSLIDKIDWNADKTHADLKGKGFSGEFNVDDTKVGIDIKLGMLAKPFKSKVEEKIRAQMTKYFG